MGGWVLRDDSVAPFVVGCCNSPDGIYVDAVLHQVADIHNLFTSALCQFPRDDTALLPDLRISVQHHAAATRSATSIHDRLTTTWARLRSPNEIVEQMRQLRQALADDRRASLERSALGFHLRHLRVPFEGHSRQADRARTNGLSFPAWARCINKYREVHEINRAGSMLDNVMYFNLRFDRDLFEPALL